VSKLVSIFVGGVQKGGTTSLFAHFCEHPALSPPSRKELHFFDEETVDWSRPDYSLLDSFFPSDDGDRLRFDITPIYSFWPPSLGRIHAYNPSAKLIFLFRDPSDRAWSQWLMEYARGNETLPFAEAIRAGRQRMIEMPLLASDRRIYTYVERGFYAGQVRRVLELFPREQVLFLRSQDLLDGYYITLARIATFLNISPFPDTGPKRENQRPDIPFPAMVTREDREFLAGLFRDDIQAFASLTGLDVHDWLTMKEG
jgi:Sulfotransferase domain